MNAAAGGADSPGELAARIWTLRGCVQGSGVRPALLRWAAKCQLQGTVRNTREGLEVWLEGETRKLNCFRAAIRENLPAGCEVSAIEETAVVRHGWVGLTLIHDAVGGQAERQAGIGESKAGEGSSAAAPLATPVPRDRALCEACRQEWMDVTNRRGGYAWITCAACGPRYSILRRMPFERSDTTLSEFPLCTACRREHESPEDRRFHAQTIGCLACGPRWWAVDDAGRRHAGGVRESLWSDANDDALAFAVRLLREGRVLALRGVGGYQLLCDATSEAAVGRLRSRKSRPTKPFAVLVGDLEAARRLAMLGTCEQDLLSSADNPIVIATARVPSSLADAVHPRMREVGLMLPTTAMHALLSGALGVPLVCTSANAAGEPLLAGVEEAERRLQGIADGWLHHDREIVHPIDDSVVRCVAGRAVTLRLGRGLAPLPLEIPSRAPRLAMGAHLKSAMALSNGRLAALGPHVGDLDTLAARQRFRDSCDAMLSLYGCEPSEILHDSHPEYATTVEAHRRVSLGSDSRGNSAHGEGRGVQGSSTVALRSVPHHAAHVAAGILEHQLWHTCVLGVAWDGAGYGKDGLVWGGEFLRVDESGKWSHVGRWRPWELPGGDVAAREPWRGAVAILRQVAAADEWLPQLRDRFAGRPLEPLLRWLDQVAPLTSAGATGATGAMATEERRSLSITRTTSVGRLFDAAAACTLGVQEVSHEGEAAMWFESAADTRDEGIYPVTMHAAAAARLELDWRPLFRSLWRDVRRGETVGRISMRFHRTLARAIIDVSDLHTGLPVVLSGGVFQNRLLGETLLEMASRPERFRLPGRVPPNDGGIAAGQLAYAALEGGSRSR